jgi:hypothetical protein
VRGELPAKAALPGIISIQKAPGSSRSLFELRRFEIQCSVWCKLAVCTVVSGKSGRCDGRKLPSAAEDRLLCASNVQASDSRSVLLSERFTLIDNDFFW